jgi:hypothetical protein
VSQSKELKLAPGGEAYIFEKGNLENKNDRRGRWDSMDGRIYVSCPQCNAISALSRRALNGLWFDRREICRALDACVVCTRCGNHHFIMLSGGEFKITEEHKKVIRMIRRGLGTGKWYGRIVKYNNDEVVLVKPLEPKNCYQYVQIRPMGNPNDAIKFYLSTSKSVNSSSFEHFAERIPAIRRMVEVIKKGQKTMLEDD